MAAGSLTDVQGIHLSAAGMLAYSRELVGSFVALAVASFVFARLRPRWGKALALIVPLTGVFGYLSLYCWEELSFVGWAVSTIALAVVALPTIREFVH
jgi:hypothetical protein